jgi:hypothetical protein
MGSGFACCARAPERPRVGPGQGEARRSSTQPESRPENGGVRKRLLDLGAELSALACRRRIGKWFSAIKAAGVVVNGHSG